MVQQVRSLPALVRTHIWFPACAQRLTPSVTAVPETLSPLLISLSIMCTWLTDAHAGNTYKHPAVLYNRFEDHFT